MPKRKQKHFGLIALLIFSCMLSMPGAEALGQLHTETKAITMEEFSSLIEAQQQSKTVEVSSAEDLDSLRSFCRRNRPVVEMFLFRPGILWYLRTAISIRRKVDAQLFITKEKRRHTMMRRRMCIMLIQRPRLRFPIPGKRSRLHRSGRILIPLTHPGVTRAMDIRLREFIRTD